MEKARTGGGTSKGSKATDHLIKKKTAKTIFLNVGEKTSRGDGRGKEKKSSLWVQARAKQKVFKL